MSNEMKMVDDTPLEKVFEAKVKITWGFVVLEIGAKNKEEALSIFENGGGYCVGYEDIEYEVGIKDIKKM